jgi:hypothetical protein
MAKVKKKAHREQVRAGCRPFGVDLGD